MTYEKEIKMDVNQLGEEFSKIHHSSLKSSQIFGKLATENAKKISQAQASLANHVAKNIQMSAVSVMAAKSPDDVLAAMKGNGSASLSEEIKIYQESLWKALDDCTHQFSQVNDEVFEHAKDGLDGLFKVACQNSPDGTEAFIKPYQAACNGCFEGLQKMQQLMTGYLHNIGNGSVQRNQKPLTSSHARKSDG